MVIDFLLELYGELYNCRLRGRKKLGVVAHAFYPLTWRQRQADLLSWRPSLHSLVLEQPQFHSETLFWKEKKGRRKYLEA